MGNSGSSQNLWFVRRAEAICLLDPHEGATFMKVFTYLLPEGDARTNTETPAVGTSCSWLGCSGAT